MTETSRIVSIDPGLLSPEELLSRHQGGRRKTLEDLIATNGDPINHNKLSFFQRCRESIRWFLDTASLKISYDDCMTIVTLFVLFGDWVKTLLFPPSSDFIFEFWYNVAFALFALELLMNCWAKSDFTKGLFHVKGYMFNFFFWLDLLCIISMIPDLKWASSLFGLGNIGSGVSAKAGKAGKIGAKTGRVVRMARLFRLVKLYKITSQRKRERKLIEEVHKLVEVGHIDKSDIEYYLQKMSSSQKQSKVGAELSDIITRRVIVAVLLMLIVTPLLSYSSPARDELEATEFLQSINVKSGVGELTNCEYLKSASLEYTHFMDSIVQSDDREYSYLLHYDILPDRCNLNNSSALYEADNFREEELREIKLSTNSSEGVTYNVNATYNIKYLLQQEAKAGIYLTIFVVFMLVSLSTQFNGDAQKLVLAPIESMMEMINRVANDPLENYDFNEINGTGEYETKVVQVAIQKITALLRVGFGVAGAEIISTNMAVEGEGSNVLEPMIPGKRIYALFGFCDIHSFDHCTERLEDEIMTFVNSVARIVHDEVTRWGGLCNKNLGNAFLIVWRIGDDRGLQSISGQTRRQSQRNSFGGSYRSILSNHNYSTPLNVDLRRVPGLDFLADKALIGFLKVLVEINRDIQVLRYRTDKRLERDSKGFKLRMGFGLHAGWAIEGAVGSLQKVDATYLSPHVNMAARMEAASRQFGVATLLTKRFFELMSPEAQVHCRKLDVVTVKGSAVPMSIYTYDSLQTQTFPVLRTPKFSSLDLEEVLQTQADNYDATLWEYDEDLVQLRRLATPEFRKIYQQGLEFYLSGDWLKARHFLEEANEMMKCSDTKNDGPSQTLLSYMESRDWKSPADWEGYRPLTSK